MDSAFWSAAALPVVAGMVMALAVEALLLPRPRTPWRREWGANAIHAGIWLLACALGFALWRRPVFAVFNGLALVLLLVAVSRAKHRVLREPFVVQDFEYFVDAIRHPRFYLPVLGVAGAVAAAIAYALVSWAGLVLEPSLLEAGSTSAFVGGVASLALAGVVLLWLGARGVADPVWDPAIDLERLGFLACLWLYGRGLWRSRHFVPPAGPFHVPAQVPQGARPAVIVVQSESFFDPRSLYGGVRPDVLREIDALRAQACQHGALRVPVWGANTVRTEFAFLAGLGEEALGVHRFNPYGRIARRGLPTIASYLKGLGYRTVCVHPFAASFYRRDLVFPKLGFDEFIDVAAFSDADRAGPFVGDEAVARKVGDLLQQESGPLFVYVITMENHGPLNLEAVAAGDVERLYSRPPPAGCEELTIYLRHLANADRMAGALRRQLEQRKGGGCLAWFGDHVPMMPAAYAATRLPEGRTEHFIWRSGGAAGRREDLAVEALGPAVLRCAGLC